jgi:[ribosomal protein S5]-alanine N-acetyltransferase
MSWVVRCARHFNHEGALPLAKEPVEVKATLETTRLILRPFEAGDVEAAFGWFGDPVVMRFTPTGPDTSIDQTKARLANYQNHQTAHGFSKWIILERRLRAAIGDSGLLKIEEHGWIDLGFRLAHPYWGKGLATEVASAWVRAAFDDFHIERLTALVHPENLASIRVLEKLRFQPERRDTIMGMNSILFSLDL